MLILIGFLGVILRLHLKSEGQKPYSRWTISAKIELGGGEVEYLASWSVILNPVFNPESLQKT